MSFYCLSYEPSRSWRISDCPQSRHWEAIIGWSMLHISLHFPSIVRSFSAFLFYLPTHLAIFQRNSSFIVIYKNWWSWFGNMFLYLYGFSKLFAYKNYCVGSDCFNWISCYQIIIKFQIQILGDKHPRCKRIIVLSYSSTIDDENESLKD